MPLPVIADLWQVTIVWADSLAPRPATNTIHIFDTAGTATATSIKTAIDTNVTADMWLLTTSNARVVEMDVTKLDGTSAQQEFVIPNAAKWTGGGSADAILQGCAVINLKSAQRGSRGRNRVFLPWVGESQQTNGTLDSTANLTMATAWATFRNAMSTASLPLHAASYLHGDSHQVTTITASPYLKTQRRRTRR